VALIDPNPVQSRRVLDVKRQSFVELAYRDTQEFATLEDYLEYAKVLSLARKFQVNIRRIRLTPRMPRSLVLRQPSTEVSTPEITLRSCSQRHFLISPCSLRNPFLRVLLPMYGLAVIT